MTVTTVRERPAYPLELSGVTRTFAPRRAGQALSSSNASCSALSAGLSSESFASIAACSRVRKLANCSSPAPPPKLPVGGGMTQIDPPKTPPPREDILNEIDYVPIRQ